MECIVDSTPHQRFKYKINLIFFRDVVNKSKELSKLKLKMDEQIEIAQKERECLISYQVPIV